MGGIEIDLLSLTKIHELLFQGKNHWQGGTFDIKSYIFSNLITEGIFP